MSAAAMLAACCAAGAAWALTLPGSAERRLRHLLTPSPPLLATLSQRVRAAIALLRARRRERSQWRALTIELCDGIGAELAAGRAPEAALMEVVRSLDGQAAGVLRAELAAASPVGPEVADVLARLAGARTGADGLRPLAACWRIGAERGGAFGMVIDGLAAALRDDEAQRAEVVAQLAGPRATARLLAGLPLLGLGMAAALGADPLAFLFGTIPGAACLTIGVGLNALGLWWTRRLALAADVPR